MNRTIGLGVVGLAIAAIYLWAASTIRNTAFGDPVGAAGLPGLLGWGLVGLSLLTIAHGAFVREGPAPASDAEPDIFERPVSAWLRGLGVIAVGAFYILIVPVVGYPVAVALTVGAGALYFGVTRDWRLPVVMVAGGVTMWVIFALLMRVRMPVGIWPGLFG